MKIPKLAQLIEVYCDGINKRGRRCGQYLGRIQTENRNSYCDFTCKNCKTTNQLFVDEYGLLIRDTLIENKKLISPAIPVYLRP